ncbi:MAG: energy transducer TonB [Deltaproteobacteria bacterium]|nr:MAG: energy transducer TonB [Deltaproteobacteria bacterium]
MPGTPDRSERPRRSARLLPFALLALLLHTLVLLLVGPLLVRQADSDTSALHAFELLAVYDRAEDQQEQPDEERAQFVALPAPDVEERPDRADFRDQFERRVEEETVSPDDRPGDGSAPERPAPPEVPSPAPLPRPPAPDRRARAREAPREPEPETELVEREREDEQEQADQVAVVDDTAAADDTGAEDSAEAGVESSTEEAGEQAPAVDFQAFRPTPDRMRVIGDSPGGRSDYLDLPEGERTQINSLTSLYWSFFQRMREALMREWDPVRVLRREDPQQELYGTRDRYTVLGITLNPDGSLRHAIVERSSGLDFLDQEAVRAFERSAPFHNVPEGMKDVNGRASFRFGFYVQYNRRSTRIQWLH